MPQPHQFRTPMPWMVIAFAFLPSCRTSAATPHPFYDDLGYINWRASWTQAAQEGLLTGKPILVEVTQGSDKTCRQYASQLLTHARVRSLLNQNFVCVSIELKRLPSALEQIRAKKGLGGMPVTLILSPQGDLICSRQGAPGPDDFLNTLNAVSAERRFQTTAAKEREMQPLLQALEEALQNKDLKRIQTNWKAIQKIPGLCPTKTKAAAVLEKAEAAAQGKLDEAGKHVREHQYPLARVCLEEAARLAEHLPIGAEVQQSLAAIPYLESAASAERSKAAKWQTQAASDYQNILQKYGESPLATVAYLRLKTLLANK